MKLAFLSDIHGNAIALDAVLQDIQAKNVDKIYVLGDICYRGPEPQRSLELVLSLNCDVIKGNADEWVVRGVRQGEVPYQALDMMNKERDWIYSQLDEKSIAYLEQLPMDLTIEEAGMKIHAFHATPNSLFEIVPPFESDDLITNKLMVNEADLYIYAHIHKPYIRYINGKCVMNIGSVGLPFDGMKKSSYALIDITDNGFQASIVRVPFDTEKVMQQYNDSAYPNAEAMINILQNAKI
ncbi:metallophosphoesterase family protein [Lederbergia panacisoli]|uniref:metallophosphoesterase family protein n=1 Tax=Lederbergia panacisoli TaxID=1255251 RepID=UPI00214C2E46|nr:metallophosphoesterase family protein [Lederbergia panacisoli]MCR2822002.1 metallophosphoesterase family protein [Lederbergia panacisoli]